MSLKQLQRALAELFTNSRAREAHRANPVTFARTFKLSDREQAQLLALAESALETYAATLLRKRRAEAARLLPQTRAVLGATFTPAFDRWAQRSTLREGSARYVREAHDFCRFVLRTAAISRDERHAIAGELRRLRR
jgi:hypothetical protein